MATGQLTNDGKTMAMNVAPVRLAAILKPRWPALLCALALLLCALATFPVAEIGIVDDWSYVQSARVLAQTGHIVYNGWATAMLGWQLYLGALFIKLFGPSFTALRASTLLVALATAILTQRIFVRAGINSRNATIGTLAFVLSPLFLPLALSFMSDMGGLFCVVLCLYACLRALEAKTDRAVLGWLAFAALSNAVGGTVRQIAWLGVLVMFPCAVWLLRRRPHVLPVGAFLYLVSLAFILGSLHWFNQQPYSVPAPAAMEHPDSRHLHLLIGESLSFFLSFALLLLPVLAAFVPPIFSRNRRTTVLMAFGGVLGTAAFLFLVVHQSSTLGSFIAPFRGDYLNVHGFADPFGIKGDSPVALPFGLRLVISAVVYFALLCFFTWLFSGRRNLLRAPAPASQPLFQSVTWPGLLALFVPFTVAYVALLVPSALHAHLFDRYLLLLLPIALIFLLRLYQDRIQNDPPALSKALVLLFAFYAVAGTHDLFAKYRARLAAVNELRAAGIPNTEIDAGLEYNAMAQIERFGHLGDPQTGGLATDKPGQPPTFPPDCQPVWGPLTPSLVPGFALSFDPNACGGLTQFPPVTYPEWLVARSVPIYIVNTVKPGNAKR